MRVPVPRLLSYHLCQVTPNTSIALHCEWYIVLEPIPIQVGLELRFTL